MPSVNDAAKAALNVTGGVAKNVVALTDKGPLGGFKKFISRGSMIDMARLSMLISVNFVTQLVVDVLAGKYVDRIGYRPCIIAAHVAAAAGLLTLGLLVAALFPVILLVGVVALRQLMHATRRDTAQH